MSLVLEATKTTLNVNAGVMKSEILEALKKRGPLCISQLSHLLGYSITILFAITDEMYLEDSTIWKWGEEQLKGKAYPIYVHSQFQAPRTRLLRRFFERKAK